MDKTYFPKYIGVNVLAAHAPLRLNPTSNFMQESCCVTLTSNLMHKNVFHAFTRSQVCFNDNLAGLDQAEFVKWMSVLEECEDEVLETSALPALQDF